MRGARVLFLIGAGLACSGCSRIWLPETVDIEAGRLAEKTFDEHFPAYKDGRWNDYLAEMGRKIAAVSERPKFSYRFLVVQSPMVNAFSLPNGDILVTTGLIKVMKGNELALAGVLAHEIGHIARRHTAEKLQAQLGYRGAAFAFFGFRGAAAGRGAEIAAKLAQTGYGRDLELEADLCAVRYLSRLGYPPRSTLAFLRRLREGESTPGLSLVDYLENHPSTSERIRYGEGYIAKYLGEGRSFEEAGPAPPGAFAGLLDPLRDLLAVYHETRGSISLEHKDYERAIVEFDRAIEASPRRTTLYKTYALRAAAYEGKKDFEAAASDLAASLQGNPWDPDIYLRLGTVQLHRKDWSKAATVCGRALDFDPEYAAAFSCMGVARRMQDDVPGALSDLERAVELKPDSYVINGELGVTRYAQGDFAGAIASLDRSIQLLDASKEPKDKEAKLRFVRFLAQRRSRTGNPGELEQAAKQWKAGWALNVEQFLSGRLQEQEFFSRAGQGEPANLAGQRSEAYFYAGMNRLFAGDFGAARSFLEQSVAAGNSLTADFDYLEPDLARRELARQNTWRPAPAAPSCVFPGCGP